LLREPMTPAEEEFLNTVFVHVNAAWELARLGPLVNRKALRSDMGHFLSHPLARLAWQRRESFREPQFAAFMNSCIGHSASEA
jgi:hypothetical protein